MKRDIAKLARTDYDLLVVGCGMHGAALAREAALSGLTVAVVDRADFCSATSANSLKVIHGGLRYLQQVDLGRLRDSVRERRFFLKAAPHLVDVLPCAMPTYGHAMKGREALFCGLLLNDLLSWDRNCGVSPARRIPRGRVVSRAGWLRLAPDLDAPRYTGAALWADAIAYNTERLALAMVQAAVESGADAANYVEVTGFQRQGRDVVGVEARDRMGGQTIAIRARVTINCTGPWTQDTLSLLGDRATCPAFRNALALNVVLCRQLHPTHAIGLTARARGGLKGSRLLFFVPWRGRTVVGTYYRYYDGSPASLTVTREDLDAFLADLNDAHPRAGIRREDVTFIHAGLLPAAGLNAAGEPAVLGHYRIVDHAQADGIGGILTVLGVKYTTARDVVRRALAMAARTLGHPVTRRASDRQALPGGDVPDVAALIREAASTGLEPECAAHLVRSYGRGYTEVLDLARADRELLKPVTPSAAVIGAEIVHAARAEMAQTLADAVLRRTDLGTAERPDDAALQACVELMARELGWDRDRVAQELLATKAIHNWTPPV